MRVSLLVYILVVEMLLFLKFDDDIFVIFNFLWGIFEVLIHSSQPFECSGWVIFSGQSQA